MSNNTIFNVPEPRGTDLVEAQTTAAAAQVDAPTATIAHEVEANAEHTQDAAHDAASIAHAKGSTFTGEPPSAINQFQKSASQKTNAAVAEGQHDIEVAKTAGAGYVEQAKSIASNALATAQSYLPTSVGGQAHPTNTPAAQGAGNTASSIASSAQSGAAAVIDTTKQYIGSVQAAVQPHIDNAKAAAPGYLGTAGTQGGTPASSTGIPATSAPLESGKHTVKSPYPSTTTTFGTNIGSNRGAPPIL